MTTGRPCRGGLYAEALAGNPDEALAKATAGLVHPGSFNTLRAAGLSVLEATDVVADAITQKAMRPGP